MSEPQFMTSLSTRTTFDVNLADSTDEIYEGPKATVQSFR